MTTNHETSAAEIARQAAKINAQAPQRLSGWDCVLLQLEGLTRGMPTGCGPVRAFHIASDAEQVDALLSIVFERTQGGNLRGLRAAAGIVSAA